MTAYRNCGRCIYFCKTRFGDSNYSRRNNGICKKFDWNVSCDTNAQSCSSFKGNQYIRDKE